MLAALPKYENLGQGDVGFEMLRGKGGGGEGVTDRDRGMLREDEWH